MRDDETYAFDGGDRADVAAEEAAERGEERAEKTGPCPGCGQLRGVASYDAELSRLYGLVRDGGRKHIEPLVYTADDLNDAYDPEFGYDAVKLSMEKNMAERGLCPECGRPDLRGYGRDDFMDEEEARDLAEMYAEMAAELRAGC